MLWLATSLVLLTGLNLAREAVFSKDLLGDDVPADLRQDVPDFQGMIENSEALIQAVRQNDPAAIQRCKDKLAEFQERERQRPAREAQRLAERAIAEKALRQRYGAAAAGLIAAGLVLSRVAQGYSARGHGKAAPVTDAVDSR